MPQVVRPTEYLQLDLGAITPIFGLEMCGSPEYEAYVTSFILLHSDDGHVFSYLLDQHSDKPQVWKYSRIFLEKIPGYFWMET